MARIRKNGASAAILNQWDNGTYSEKWRISSDPEPMG
jgi:hypothetical protein